MKPKGSSPLTRGKHVRLSPLADDQRLIPAHAGKTAIRAETVDGIRAHPRSRGENASASLWMYGGAGSSPLTRGKLDRSGAHLGSHRLIPAHAGKTQALNCPHLVNRAHPRSRGENSVALKDGDTLDGSSPLTRGKLEAREIQRGLERLIPAHAGKTPTDATTDLATGAHPRSRGENRKSRL